MNKLLIRARSIARKSGLKNLYYRIFPQKDYEKHFHDAMMTALKPGDVVWDIGANRGLYARIFGEKTGSTGRVIAFEPTPDSYAELCRQTAELPWVKNEQVAMGESVGTGLFVVGEHHVSNHLQRSDAEIASAETVEVAIVSGDSYWASCGVTPNFIKIDVEGYEEEVLTGMNALLSAQELRAVFVEVHFEVLEGRGRADAPIRLEKMLRGKGLKATWVDASHIAALRSA